MQLSDHVKRSKQKAMKPGSVARKKERRVYKNNSSTGNRDLGDTKELHSLGYYIGNREEMVNQAFAAIRGKDLKALLFPALEHLSIKELKALCLEQLREMADRDIKLVLEGRKLNTSSKTATGEADEKLKGKKKICAKKQRKLLDKKLTKGEVNLGNAPATGSSDLAQCSSSEVAHEIVSSTSVETEPQLEKSEDCDTEEPESRAKLIQEVLELEMRARAIRALLKQHE